MVILAGAFVASLNTISGARASQATVAQQRMGMVLAEDLMSEVLSKVYKEPGVSVLGLDADELLGVDRSNYDDIDDYDGWENSPPTDSSGVKIEGAEAYTRSVTVVFTQLGNPYQTSFTDQGMKKITVTVTRGGKQVAQLTSYRSDVYDAFDGE